MKRFTKILFVLIVFFASGKIYSQQVARATDVQIVTEPGTKIVVEGGITFKGTTNWLNNGETHLYKTTMPSPEGWLDSTASGVLDNLGTGHVFFRGNNRQSFYGKTRFYNLSIRNTAGDTLLSAMEVKNTLNLDTGYFVTRRGYGNDSLLVSNPATTAIASSSNYTKSWVNGRLSRTGNATAAFYLFPVGGADSPYAPVKLQKLNTTTATWTAEYNFAQPFDRTNIFNPPVDHISEVEYWEISSNNQASTDDDARLSLSWRGQSHVSANPVIRDSLIVAQYINNGGLIWDVPGSWTPPGNSVGADSLFGFVTSFAPSNNYTYDERRFTLGTISRYNALPVKLLYFAAIADGNKVRLIWETANEQDVLRYVIEKSLNAVNFTSIGSVNSRQLSQSEYTDFDLTPAKGWNYYRLKIIDKSGISFYSPVRRVKFENGFEQVKLFPVPASTELNILLPTSYLNQITLQVTGVDGRFIATLKPTTSRVILNVKPLAAGTYFIQILKTSGSKETYPFIRQ